MRPNSQESADLVTFTEEIFEGKLYFLCSVREFVYQSVIIYYSRLIYHSVLQQRFSGQKKYSCFRKSPGEISCPHSWNCIRIYIFWFKKKKKTRTHTQTKRKKLKKLAGCKFWDLQWYVHVSDWILHGLGYTFSRKNSVKLIKK